MAVYIEGHAESLEEASAKGVAATERLEGATKELSATQTKGASGFASYSSTTRSASKATDEHERSSKRLGGTLRSTAASGAAFIGAFAGYEAIKGSIEFTHDLVHETEILTRVTGLDAKAASQWIELANQRGIATSKLQMGFGALSKQIRGAETGSSTAAKGFHALGIPLEELRHLSTEEVLMKISDALAGMNDKAERAALTQQFFGKSGRELLPILSKGSDGVKQQLGLFEGLTEAQQKQGEEAIALQRKVGVEMDELKLKVTFAMLGVAKAISNPKLTLDEKIDYVVKKADTVLERGITFMAGNAADHAPEVAEAFVKGFVEAPILGQAVFGSLLLAKFGGFSLLGGVFTKEGKLSATSFMGGMKTALPAAVAAAGLDNILNSALHGDTEGALYKSGGAMAGTVVGGLVGGLPGAMIGSGVGSLLGGKLADALDSKDLTPLQRKLASSSRQVTSAFKAQQDAVSSLASSGQAVVASHKRQQRASQEVHAAEAKLAEVRRKSGANSQPAIKAERELAHAKERDTEATKDARFAERQHGVELQITKEKLALAAVAERKRTTALRESRSQLMAQRTAMKENGATAADLGPIDDKLIRNSRQLRQAQKQHNETLSEAVHQVGPKFAHYLREANNLTLELTGSQSKQQQQAKGIFQAIERGGTAQGKTLALIKRFAEESGTSMGHAKGNVERFGRATENTSTHARRDLGEIQGSYKGLDQVSSHALGDLAEKTNAFLTAIGAKTAPFELGKAMGGPVTVPGAGLQDTVPITHSEVAAVVAPGEKLYVANRHQEPLLDQAVSNEYGVNGLQGFYETFNRPHYMAVGGLYEPKLRGGVGGLRRGGQRGIHRAYKGAVKYVEAHDGIGRVIANGNRMDALHQPYVWGGGHGSTASRNGPWDCSGGTSELFDGAGFNFPPMVSGGFASWGLPGKGDATVLANSEHVYAVLKTPSGYRAIGTSAENPGGGYGWIDGYTFRPGFTIRHADFSQIGLMRAGGKRGNGQKQKKGFSSGGLVVSGKASYESGTGNTTADGKHTDEDPGFAIRDDSTLGDWFWAEVGGASGMLQHIDWGPAASTGRSIDFTAAGLRKIGAPLNITDKTAKVTWLGHTVAEASKNLPGKTKKGPSKAQIKALHVSKGVPVELPGLKPEHLTGAALDLPAPIQSLLKSPGLSFARKLEVGQFASQLASSTKGTDDDVAAAKYTAQLEERNKRRIQKELAKIGRELKQRMSPERRKMLLAHREQLLSGLAGASSELAAAKGTISGGAGEEGGLEGEDEAVIKQAEEEARRQEEIAQKLQEILDVTKQESEERKRALDVSQSQYGALAQAVTAVVSGQIGGHVGLAFATPSVAGSLASY
jgi:hypothetical protein